MMGLCLKMMTRGMVILLLCLHSVLSYAQVDSVCVNNVNELTDLVDSNVRVLAINFALPRKFDYSIIPNGVICLRFLKPSRNLKQPGSLFDKMKNLETIELNGKMVEFLPEVLYFAKKVQRVDISDAKLSRIWEFSGFMEDVAVREIRFKNLKIDEECNMYKSIFYNGRLTAGVLYLEADRMPKAEKLALLMDVFETKDLYINGKKQTVYVD